MKFLITVFWILCLVQYLGDTCWASDEKRESEFADGINKTLAMGKAVWLESEGNKFLGLYTETEKLTSKGTVIILHDMGGHPNQRQLIYGLRVYLPEHNWATLALQSGECPIMGVGGTKRTPMEQKLCGLKAC